MLQRTLTEHAAECFFGDERLAAWLWDKLLKSADALESDRWQRLQDDFYHLLLEGVEARYPREHRLTDVRQLMGRMLDGDLLLTPSLPWLDELQQRLLQRNGDLLCYRDGEVQAYVRLAAGIDPTLLASWHLAQWLNEMSQPQAHDIRRVVSAQTAFFAPPGNPSLPFAESHVHWGGVSADSAILDARIFETLSKKKQIERVNSLPALLKQARRLLVLLLNQNLDWSVIHELATDPVDVKDHWPDLPLLQENQRAASVGSADWLLGEFARAMDKQHSNRWLWLYIYLCRCYLQHTTNPKKRAAILCFWQKINQLRRSLIMDGQGLTRFVEQYSSSALKKGVRPTGGDAHKVGIVWSGANDVAEVKSNLTSFDDNAPNGIKPLFNEKFAAKIAAELVEKATLQLPPPPFIFGEHEIPLDGKTLASIQAMERWQFCGHFLKR